MPSYPRVPAKLPTCLPLVMLCPSAVPSALYPPKVNDAIQIQYEAYGAFEDANKLSFDEFQAKLDSQPLPDGRRLSVSNDLMPAMRSAGETSSPRLSSPARLTPLSASSLSSLHLTSLTSLASLTSLTSLTHISLSTQLRTSSAAASVSISSPLRSARACLNSSGSISWSTPRYMGGRVGIHPLSIFYAHSPIEACHLLRRFRRAACS